MRNLPGLQFCALQPFRGFHGSHICYGLPVCSPPCTDPTSFPAVGDFYVQASDGSVTLPAAGYDYSSGWTPPLVGLAPTGTTASLAARSLCSTGNSGLRTVATYFRASEDIGLCSRGSP